MYYCYKMGREINMARRYREQIILHERIMRYEGNIIILGRGDDICKRG